MVRMRTESAVIYHKIMNLVPQLMDSMVHKKILRLGLSSVVNRFSVLFTAPILSFLLLQSYSFMSKL